VTTTLKLGTGVTLVPERNPLLLAKEVATLDYFSKGRFIFGIGAGWNKEETEIMGGDFAHRWTQTREAIEAMKALWADEAAEYHGTYYRFPPVRSFPRPVQQPHPPIIVGGAGGPRIAQLVARWADEFNTVRGTPDDVRARFENVRRAVGDAGRDPSSITTSLMTWFVLGRDDDEYRSKVERARSFDPDASPFDEYLAEIERDWIVGTPDRAVERLRAYADAGVERIVLNHHLYDDLEMLELLGAEVMPALAR
jgi:probable F420-dependent oxidoreductase